MNKHSWGAVGLFTGIFLASFFVGGHPALFLNGLALVIVVCGTLGALFLCYPAADIQAALCVMRNVYRHSPPTNTEIISTMLEVDPIKDEELSEILHTEMFHFKQRRAQIERIFRQGALLAPAFGVAGSVIGLIDMLAGITNPSVILLSIPVALVSPLYGIVLANTVFFSLAEGIHVKTQKELLIQMIITRGVLIIRQETDPIRLALKLESFLTPSARA